MVLKRPKKESAMKAPSTGKSVETPTQVLTFLTAVVKGWWSSFVRYMMRFPTKPQQAKRSAISTTVNREKKNELDFKDEEEKEEEERDRDRDREKEKLTDDENGSIPATSGGSLPGGDWLCLLVTINNHSWCYRAIHGRRLV